MRIKMIRKIIQEFLGQKEVRSLLDTETKNMLLSAAGSFGGDLCDCLLQYTDNDDEKFIVSIETGVFGIAVVAYYYTIKYRYDTAPLILATELLDSYKNFYADNSRTHSREISGMIKDFIDNHGKSLLSTTIGSLLSEAENSNKIYWTLSRVLYQKIRESCMSSRISLFKLEIEQINEIEERIRASLDPLIASIGYFIEQDRQNEFHS